jgi:hypothetical protein
VLIVGAGIAGLETLVALRALAVQRLGISSLAPEWTFVDHSTATRQPFVAPCVRASVGRCCA